VSPFVLLVVTAIAGALSVDNIAAGLALGLDGVDSRLRRRVATIFGGCAVVAPVIGIGLGHAAAPLAGGAARLVAGLILVGIGAATALRTQRGPASGRSIRDILAVGMAVNADSLVSGFALGLSSLPVLASISIIALVTTVLTVLAVEIGGRIGRRWDRGMGPASGAILVAVGIGLAAGLVR